ncbi:MAG: hypothetical protein C0407_06385, partial [Desulfobacca sp.]|nr:hypothetical protein [Desulfobacca sp.]
MKEKLLILNLEDNPTDAELNKEALTMAGLECEILRVETREAFLNAIEQGGWDIILADQSLPSYDGFSALDLASKHCPEVPFVFVSGTLGEEIAIEALKRGATDYVLKDRLSRLPSAVLRALKEKEERIERRRAEQALLESENTLRSIFKAAPTGIGVTFQRVLSQANDRLLEMVGYSREELIGQSARILYPTDEGYKALGQQMNDHLRTAGAGEIETQWRRQDGKVFDVLLKTALINPSDLLGGITFTALDITERKQAEDALRRSEERQSRLIQQTFDLILETDQSGFVKTISPQSEQVFGAKPEELIGKHFLELIIESDRERVAGLFQKALGGEGLGAIEFRGKRKNGQDAHCELKFVLEEAGGKVNGFFGVIRDLTEWHKIQDQLQQSQKMEAIGTLAGGIAHDFNNILGAIIGYTQLTLYDLPEESPLLYNLEQVLKASDRAKDLITQILTFSRQSEHEKTPIQIVPVVKEALKLLRASLPKSIEIRKKKTLKEDTILGDPTQIHQVLMNLCTNAAQSMQGRPGVIEIDLDEINLDLRDLSIFQGLRPGHYLRLSVSDTGAGIDPAILIRIFDPFFTTKKIGEGTGMGLSVVHGIVKNHGGEIVVYSEPGKGSTFRVYLPLIKKAKDSEGKTRGDFPGGNERVLFVDDEPGLVETWVQLLVRLGYQVTSRQSSIEALELFRTN